ncbi:hypothetical protein BU23DRAFT_557571 [Bimuria novae-zelandiae CBS 107.79]|uniref:Uncharacterized protein n=1 Tax=Bimuria novae-zelandiae CBS 107.79 TaxID=1447943 RepID=A0A6A5UXU1_9PLEO|nr:hypothetical protein BU23DRAFT_557571 [Bimuria novae-zelandiae CBS 107.79]
MATSPTALAQPTPVPFRAAESSTSPDLQHPTPDLQAIQGAYIGNIERLEEHAERMSEKGSDLGEEIRKLHNEQKLSDSRRSSLLSASVAEEPEPIRLVGTRSRGASTSSFTNSIVDVNGTARWGGYSPGGYMASPTGSLRSSTSQPVALQRQRSNSKASRLDHQITRVDEEEEAMERIEEHPASPSPPRRDSASQHERARSVSSFTREYDEIANELQQELRNSVILADGYEQQQHEQQQRASYYNHADLPDRPPTAASTDTTHKLRTLWHDFDGTHAPDTVPEDEPLPNLGNNGSRDSSMLKSAPDLPPQGAPPPDDGMVYYPAPVPRMLNLPQRLSKVPNTNVQAKRRTQILESMQNENRKSAPWLSGAGPEPISPKANRKSRNLANLPPTLRASVFFDAPAPVQEFEVKGDSARDTLDNILEASAHAPVSAFTDHPYAGHVGDDIYGQEKKQHKRTGSKANELDKVEARKSRSSLNLLDTRRNSNGDALNKLKKRNSSADLNLLTVRATEGRMSLGEELDHHDPDARGPDPDNEQAAHSADGDHEHAIDDEEESDAEEQPEEQFFGAPTTLLAELQMRKAQQKTRNLTAATAFPNGMHSTLLELDAVAEIEKQKRLKKKVNLAWEAQAPEDEDASSDDDVPLGMLFPGREGLVNKRPGAPVKDDWDRPLGLIAQREIENNEPLSARRARLLGGNRNAKPVDPAKRNTQLNEFNNPGQSHLAVPASATPQAESEEDEGETLAQRMRRMKDQHALDDVITDVRKSTFSADFSTELMSQFGVNEEEKSKPAAPPAKEGEEETLGERRARLQAEALARGDVNPHDSHPPLRASMSMADVLGAHPIDPNNSARKVSDEQLLSALPAGSLLHQNAVKQERRRVSRMDMHHRVSSHVLDQPLLGDGVGKAAEDQPIGAKIQAYKEKMAGTGAAMPRSAPAPTLPGTAMPNASMSSVNLLGGQREPYFPQSQPMPMVGMNGMNGFPMMPQQMMGMQMGMMPPQMMGMPGMPYPQMGAMGMPGMRHSSMVNLPPMGVGMMNPQMMGLQQPMGTVMMEPPMDPRQRDAIDRWRSSVMH